MQEELQIISSWQKNASAWAKSIAEGSIESRILVTNKAMLDVIVQECPASVLDLGCGEGWLLRALKGELPNAKLSGIDAIPALIEVAKMKSPEIDYQVFSYQSIIDGAFKPTLQFDIVAINFALFGNELVGDLLQTVHRFIKPGGLLIIQTLHPHAVNENLPYCDGWRPGSWKGFSEEFTDPSPWYFRTLQSWVMLLSNCGFSLKSLIEPLHPISQQPLSVLFIACPRKEE
jgi:2-polyprenyl-3-methyl-5-hydroxy-6-metoxy-1,4-benzoquinol methylase